MCGFTATHHAQNDTPHEHDFGTDIGRAPIQSNFSFNLPVELWREVIVSAVETLEPMDNYHDASEPLAVRFHLARRVTSESPEYALMLVCKSFNHITTEFFYEKISIHSKTQLVALSKCLQSSNTADNLAKWTRRLDLKYASREPDHNGRVEESLSRLAPILRLCPNLTHLILDVVDFQSEDGYKDVEVIVDACAKSCKRLQVLHCDFELMIHERVAMTLGLFLTAFRNIKVLRLGNTFRLNTPTLFNGTDEAVLDGLPFLHTIEASQLSFFLHFRMAPLPSLSTFHVRNDNFADNQPLVLGMRMFLPPNEGHIKTLTIVGTVGERYAASVATCIRTCVRLEELVMDVHDLVRLLSQHQFQVLHPQVIKLSLTNYAPTTLPSGNNFRATLFPNLRARFPALEVLLWLGNIDRSVSRSDTQEGLGDGADTSQVRTSEIRIENRDGEKLELDWLLVR